MQPDPVWPALILIAVQVGDGIACAIPTPFITAALDRVNCPHSIRRVLPWIKFASAAGLLAGLWIPVLGALTAVALTGYFVIALVFHVRARDTVISTAGAVAMLAFVSVVLITFLRA